MKLEYNRRVILRIPRFPFNADLKDHWPQLKSLISESSVDFYEKIKDLEYNEIVSQPERIRHTIWKYFNRSKNRSTPFGGLASVAVIPGVFTKSEQQSIIMSDAITMHELPDWSLKEDVSYTYDELYAANGHLFANSTYYLVGVHSIRYVGFFNDSFELMEMPKDTLILEILSHTRSPIPVQKLSAQFPKLNQDEFKDHIEALVAMQLLKTSMDSNIIGEDYFKRISYKPESAMLKYSISERRHMEGEFDFRLLRGLNNLVSFLQRNRPQQPVLRLNNFIEQFRSRYDEQQVPLMLALDPEYGLGYAELEQQHTENEIIGQLSANRTIRDQQNDLVTAIKKTIAAESVCQSLEIDLEALMQTADEVESKEPLPNSMSFLFTLSNGKIWMEHLGGVTATAMAGRFTLALPEIHTMTREIAEKEANANPDVVFFDIGYMAEGRVDNVNRRQKIYNRQLSILNYDTSVCPITLDDITIQLRGNELILRSRSLQKRLIPRLASAYNHTRSDLSVFRLLCDLQQQGLNTTFNVHLETHLTYNRFYPRVRYRQFILSPAKWRIRKKDLASNETLFSYLKKLGVPDKFRAGAGDQVLYFDRCHEEDIQVLTRILEKEKEVLLEETVIPDSNLIKDTAGNSYTGQFLVQLQHDNPLYNPVVTENLMDIPATPQRDFLLNSAWQYFQIFCHPAYTDTLLNQIYDFVKVHKRIICKWFFIRYDVEGEHIRLRFNLHDRKFSSKLSAALMDHLASPYQQGSIWDIRQRIYRRELERYGNDMIDDVERHFQLDSEYVLTVNQDELSEMHRYQLCVQVIRKVSENLNVEPARLHPHIDRTIKGFEHEHQLQADGFKQLNELIRKINSFEAEPLSSALAGNFDSICHSLIRTVNTCPEHRRPQLFTDLLHMHVNRLFRTDQRTHELAIYYMFIKNSRR